MTNFQEAGGAAHICASWEPPAAGEVQLPLQLLQKRTHVSRVGPHSDTRGAPGAPCSPKCQGCWLHGATAGSQQDGFPLKPSQMTGQVLGDNTHLAICTSEQVAMDGLLRWNPWCSGVQSSSRLWLSFPADNFFSLPTAAQGRLSFPPAPLAYTFFWHRLLRPE